MDPSRPGALAPEQPPRPPPGHASPPGRPSTLPDGLRPVAASAGLALALVPAAVATDVAARHGLATVAGSVLVVALAVGLLCSSRLRRPSARVLAVAAVVPGALLCLRASPWAVLPAALAALGALGLAASLSRSRGLRFLGPAALTVRTAELALSPAPGSVVAARSARLLVRRSTGADRSGPRRDGAVRGVALAVPVVVVLGALLASADAVFAAWIRLPVDVDELPGHLVLLVVGALAAAGLVQVASTPEPASAPPARWVGATEATIVLAAVSAVFALFAAAQLVAVAAGDDYVQRTAGLTYADYARQGFAQLVGVVVVTVALLASLRALLRAEGRTSVVVGLAVVVGTAAALVAVVALRRLDLYQQAFGLTQLRLAVTFVAWWLAGVVLLVTAAFVFDRRAGGDGVSPLPAVSGAVALTLLMLLTAFAAADPDAVVARHNLARAADLRLDTAYVGTLSDDAVPDVVAALPTLSPPTRDSLEEDLCRPSGLPRARSSGAPAEPPADAPGGLGANRSVARAADARREVCGR